VVRECWSLGKVTKVEQQVDGNEKSKGNCTSDDAYDIVLDSTVVVACDLLQFGDTVIK
jgi:hypothetical protein